MFFGNISQPRLEEPAWRNATGQNYVQILETEPSPSKVPRLLGEGYGMLQIADAIGLSYKTVANNCSQMKNRLGVARTADLIRIAVEHRLSNRGRIEATPLGLSHD